MESNIQFPPLKPNVVLGVAAHPDDLDFGSAATMAKFAAEGADVFYLLLTDGSKGSNDMGLTSSELISIRQEEQKAALLALGGKGITFLDFVDAELELSLELKKLVVAEIRKVKPDVVITMDPTLIYSEKRGIINHPDHRAAGQATLDAVYPLARDHLAFPDLYSEGLKPHKVSTVLLNNFDRANFYIDVSSTIEKKWQALKCHASQIEDFAAMKKRFSELARTAGKQGGYQYAEGFIRLDLAL